MHIDPEEIDQFHLPHILIREGIAGIARRNPAVQVFITPDDTGEAGLDAIHPETQKSVPVRVGKPPAFAIEMGVEKTGGVKPQFFPSPVRGKVAGKLAVRVGTCLQFIFQPFEFGRVMGFARPVGGVPLPVGIDQGLAGRGIVNGYFGAEVHRVDLKNRFETRRRVRSRNQFDGRNLRRVDPASEHDAFELTGNPRQEDLLTVQVGEREDQPGLEIGQDSDLCRQTGSRSQGTVCRIQGEKLQVYDPAVWIVMPDADHQVFYLWDIPEYAGIVNHKAGIWRVRFEQVRSAPGRREFRIPRKGERIQTDRVILGAECRCEETGAQGEQKKPVQDYSHGHEC